jgi:hypothetical protein
LRFSSSSSSSSSSSTYYSSYASSNRATCSIIGRPNTQHTLYRTNLAPYSPSRTMATGRRKIKVKNPVVEMDGDEVRWFSLTAPGRHICFSFLSLFPCSNFIRSLFVRGGRKK